jgi:hypothetical protein
METEFFLLDTNVVSETTKPRPNEVVVSWLDVWDLSQTYISVITIGEIRKGIETCASARKRIEIEHWLDHELLNEYRSRLLPVDIRVANCWGNIISSRKQLDPMDALIAATALVHDMTLVTRNTKHFRIGNLRLLNPWDA